MRTSPRLLATEFALPWQVAVLCALVVALGLVAWLVSGREGQLILPASIVIVPLTIATGYLLFLRQAEKEAARHSLASVHARFSDIAESAMDPIISIDEHQRVVLFNAAAEHAFRWPRGAVLGQPLDMLLPPRFRERHDRHVAQFGATGVTSRRMGGPNALIAMRATGEEFPIEASISQHVEDGRKILTVILRDVTERVRSEILLARSEARLRGIVDSAMDAIITVDGQQKIVLFNAAAETMFGCPQDEAIGGPLAWFIPDRFRHAHLAHVSAFAATGVTSRRMGGSRVVMGLRRDGTEFPIDASISQLADGGATFFTVILRDVSERAAALDALAQSREELRDLASAASSAREQEQTRIARELHDELAQSLSALKMDLQLIRHGLPAIDAAVGRRLDRMETQVDATIAAMRRIAADLRPLALDDLGLVPAVESLVHEFERRNAVSCELAIADHGLVLPAAHATAVFRIVQECLTNVAKHARASQVEVVIGSDASAVTVSVQDDGVGFTTTKPRNAHSFGLLGVRERTYLLGGALRITSAPGEGTEIEARLPMAT